jgi:hypothetical protein
MKLSAMKLIAAGFVLILGCGISQAQTRPDSLMSGFENPPQSARPRVWWHWMNGNITKEGIKLDLEWMHRVGIAGFQNFDAALNTPQVVDHRLAYMTPEWKDAFKYATTLADQLGMEEAIAGSPGWSESGGPWVPPAEGMKKYVWSETVVEGGQAFQGKLPKPPSVAGPFQSIARSQEQPPPEFYADSAVVAYRAPADDTPSQELHATVTFSGGSPDVAMLSDGDLEKATQLPIAPEGSNSWIQYEFPSLQTIRAITYVINDPPRLRMLAYKMPPPEVTLEASDNGEEYRVIATLSAGRAAERTISFPAVTAKFFRVTFKRTPPQALPAALVGVDPATYGPPITDYDIAELVLHPGARVNHFEEKAAFVPVNDLYGFVTPDVTPPQSIAKGDVIDLTTKMHPDGTLDWTPPPGKWVVLRFGYSLLGITNHPATKEATGLEVDKMDHRFVARYMNTYLDSYRDTVGFNMMGKRGLTYIINDSWEAGSQNWTDNMIEQFKKLRGYDPLPWMPVLTGRIVESSEASDGFLWDFRKTIADLIANEHYGQLEATIRERKMGHYGESHEVNRAFVADGMEVKKFNEVPMGAMWTQLPGVNKDMFGYNADDRESASVAHIYGQNLAAAESMTTCDAAAAWAWSPATLKPTADAEFLDGINRFVIHESAHQPLFDKVPGMTLGPCGQWFNRNETWADQAGPWVDYLSRTSYLLQQGHFGADMVYFYGEDSDLTAIFASKAPDIPAGYGFDYINADGLIHELSVNNGMITTPSGMSYRALGLDPYSRHMSLPVLRAIHKLVEDGATVAGPKPTDDPSLADDQGEFARLSDELFGIGGGVHQVGKGTVYSGQTLTEVFDALKLAPDFEYTKPDADARLLFVHRKLTDGDLYFIDNRGDHPEQVDATFRVAGREPELWRAETGQSEAASFKIANGRTAVPLKLEPWGTVFVVFRTPTTSTSRTLPEASETLLSTLSGPWSLSFQPDRGAPPAIVLDKLSSWSDNADAGVKYFSGTGTYTKSLDIPADWLKADARIWIDLGDVKNLAEIVVNGQNLGEVWHAPYRIDATAALKPGSNDISIKVTNAWVNRLIGDEQPGAVKITFADVKPYRAESALLPSGLLGPVTISSITLKEVKTVKEAKPVKHAKAK